MGSCHLPPPLEVISSRSFLRSFLHFSISTTFSPSTETSRRVNLQLSTGPEAQRWRSSGCFQAVTSPLTFYSLLQHCQPVGDLRLQLVDAECSVEIRQMIQSKPEHVDKGVRLWNTMKSAPSESWKISANSPTTPCDFATASSWFEKLHKLSYCFKFDSSFFSTRGLLSFIWEFDKPQLVCTKVTQAKKESTLNFAWKKCQVMGQRLSLSLEFLKTIDGKAHLQPFLQALPYLCLHLLIWKFTQDCKKTTKHKSLIGSGSHTPSPICCQSGLDTFLEMQSAYITLK